MNDKHKYLIYWRNVDGKLECHETNYEYHSQFDAVKTCFGKWAKVLYSFKIKPK